MEWRFVCKYCYRRFPCGKSLGGHIRTHMTQERNNAADADSVMNGDERKNKNQNQKKKRDLSWSETIAGSSTIYGLRENPKKTIRFVYTDHHAAAALEHDQKFCKECGKGFPSLKALCGHMASHSEKDKRMTNKFEEEKLILVDSESDNETCSTSIHTRRSKRMRRIKSLNPSSSAVDASSPVSEVEQEEEEVARCLMILSRDSSHKGRFASESSDNNSIVLEPKSSSPYGYNFVSNNAYELKEKKLVNDKTWFNHVLRYGSDSRYLRYGSGTKMVQDKSGFEDYDFEIDSGKSKFTTQYKKLLFEVLDDDDDDDKTDETTRRFDSRNRANYGSLSHNLVGFSSKNSAKGLTNDEEINEKYESDSYSTDESDQNSSESDSFHALNGKKTNKAKNRLKTKKSKEHECPICYRIFKSGQALGGHKRSHFMGGSEVNNNTLVIKQGGAVPNCLIDLNLPAPDDD